MAGEGQMKIALAAGFLLCLFLAGAEPDLPAELSHLSDERKELLAELSRGWEEGWQNYLVGERRGGDLREANESVNYLVWTRTNPKDAYILEAFNDNSAAASPLDPSRLTFVGAHGFGSGGMTGWILRARDEYLAKFDCNVISVDYGDLVVSPFYVQAVLGVYEAADVTASVLDWLVESHGFDLQLVQMVGHSLGAHMLGMTGLWVQQGTVARVTGLDPAGPLFYIQNDTHRITPASASFVDVIHSNSGSVLDGCLGLFSPVGHVDFYPNGGHHQPGCIWWNSSTADWLDMFGSCSHERAPEYWLESLATEGTTANSFYSWPCLDYDTFASGQCTSCQGGCLEMGLPAIEGIFDESSELNYYLDTAPHSPYALGGGSETVGGTKKNN